MKFYHGTYSGIVREVKDPTKLGRIKVSVPLVYGVSGPTTEEIGIENIPWALPAGMPTGGSAASGGMDWLPEPGDQVWVRFLDGEPEKPIWEWGTQTFDQAKNFQLHEYDKLTKKPKRGALTRYGHTLDFSDGALILTTKNGYSIIFADSDLKTGKVTVSGPVGNKVEIDDENRRVTVSTVLGQMLELDDLNSNVTMLANANIDIQSAIGEISAQGASISLRAFGEGVTVRAFTEIKLAVGTMTLSITPAGFNFSQGS